MKKIDTTYNDEIAIEKERNDDQDVKLDVTMVLFIMIVLMALIGGGYTIWRLYASGGLSKIFLNPLNEN